MIYIVAGVVIKIGEFLPVPTGRTKDEVFYRLDFSFWAFCFNSTGWMVQPVGLVRLSLLLEFYL